MPNTLASAVAAWLVSGAVFAQGIPGQILGDPSTERRGFRSYELAFVTPTDGVARSEFKSETFYAVILETFPPCIDGEMQRRKVQALFPGNKVFATRFGCEGVVQENIDYTNVDPKWGFMAVYAGTTLAEGQELLEKVRRTTRFRNPSLRQMQAILVYP
jgi:hypothetical protein